MSAVKEILQKSKNIHTEVIVVGNGPSAICLSFLLSGNRPYYNGLPHPNSYLYNKLRKLGKSESIIDQNLEYLCEGLEGRSHNPVAVLFDSLCHPDADLGADNPSVLSWRKEPQYCIPHVVLGKTKPGGAWQMMDGGMQTLSLGGWMELPSMSFPDWLSKHRRSDDGVEPCMNRATMADVRNYYTHFVQENKLQKHFYDYHTVTSIQKVGYTQQGVDNDNGETEQFCSNFAKNHQYVWEVRGYKLSYQGNNESEEPLREEFCMTAPNVVLATGTFDIPNQLGVPGESRFNVMHSLHEFESVINEKKVSANSDPVLVVGAGLSAADAILMALQNDVPVVHAFRCRPNDSNLILRKLPQNMYPEYHQVYLMMKGLEQNSLYKPFSRYQIKEFGKDKVLLCSETKEDNKIISLDYSYAAILIGSRPDLSYLTQDGRNLGVVRKRPIESKHNPIDIDPFSHQCMSELGLYALGPLVGDNFVRFAIGGGLGITNYLWNKKRNLCM
ncbi:hypothetical protein ACJMK2_008898 [Sinanodonta woodiana]|uniref:Oxidative stress-induced growth inhibitor 2 n=1 Tax=Sinanodonta woodiana TaxID=1069815 RepID=A0ABD3VAL6_SINWO